MILRIHAPRYWIQPFLAQRWRNPTTWCRSYQPIWITVTMFYLPLQKTSRLFHQRNTVKHGHLQRFSHWYIGTWAFCCTSNATSSSSALTLMEAHERSLGFFLWERRQNGQQDFINFGKYWICLCVFSLFLQVFWTKHTPKNSGYLVV